MRQQAIKEISAKAASERISNGTEKEKEEKKEGEMETFGDWRSMLQRLNDQVKLVVKLPEVVTLQIAKDYVDIKMQYRRLKIEEQCRKLSPKVNLPSRSSWRDRMNGNVAATNAETTDISKRIESPSARIKKLSLELRRTAVYYVDSSINVHNFKITDTIHLKRSQIEPDWLNIIKGQKLKINQRQFSC